MTSSIERDRASYLKARAIVIDLRGNEGGSSDWSLQLAKALWGATVVDAKIRARDEKTSTWWRASAENTAYFSQIVGQLRGEGQNDVANEVEKIAAGMTSAQQSGEKFFVEPASLSQDFGANRPGMSDQVTPLTAPIYVIVPGQCASACLDAVDVFKLFPAVKLVGAPSSADSAYLEVRTKMLPSGFAEVIIPNKMYVGRSRPNGGFYRPDLALADPGWSTANFLSMIKRDASTKR